MVAPDLPCDDESAGLAEYTDTVLEAIGDRSDLVVVAQSFGGFIAPIVCSRVSVQLLVLVAGMIPRPGETGSEYWANTGWKSAPEGDESEIALFMHDVPPDLAAEALERAKDQADAPALEPWPLEAWPDVPTRYLLCREDRLFPAEWTRRLVRDRLGIDADEIDGGHTPALGRPAELAERLEGFRAALGQRG